MSIATDVAETSAPIPGISELQAGSTLTKDLEHQNCCELSHTEWNSTIHKSLVSTAVEGLKSIKDPAIEPHAKAFLTRWSQMQANLEDGLDKADLWPKYTDVFYSTHFYDPDARKTWGVNPGKNALSEGSKRYFEAAKKLEDGAPVGDFGFDLGVALHYLTDLAQPMHAANFIEKPGVDARHSAFEKAADEYNLATPTYSNMDLGQWRSPGQVIREMAIQSKRLFTSTLAPLLAKKAAHQAFTLEEIRPTMDAMAKYALPLIAAFVMVSEIGRVGGTVNTLYHRFLERPADAEGLRNWGGQLANGATIQQIVMGLVGSAEFLGAIGGLAKTSIPDATRALYKRCLARGATDAEVREWEGWMKAGRYEDSARYLVASTEYEQRFGPHITPY